MQVETLKITNMRAIAAAEFRFGDGFNLVVGVNGVGKTTLLDALGVCLAAVVKQANKLRTRTASLTRDDIRVGAGALTVECVVHLGDGKYTYLVHRPRETSVAREDKAGMPREQVHDTPKKAEFRGEAPVPVSGAEDGGRPLAVLYSTRRAVPNERAPGKAVAAGGIAGAFADAFANRELRLGEVAAWMRVQQALSGERPAAARVLKVCEAAVSRFLPGYSHLRPGDGDKLQLFIDRGQETIPVRQLSDGERSSLALVLDLTRRLVQANPKLDDPASNAEAVVLIDEIDLHLHPKWQRQIVHNLTAAFPRCQFIATTHSPQVISEVPHDRVQIMTPELVYSPEHSYGIDSSRVLEEIMDVTARPQIIEEKLQEIARLSRPDTLGKARKALGELADKLELGENDPEVTRLRTLLDFMEMEP